MKKTVLILLSFSLLVFKTNGQKDTQTNDYKVPSTFRFDYKVIYQVNSEEKDATQTITYYFSKSNEYMGIQPNKEDGENSGLIIYTSDGTMIMFSEEQNQKHPQKTITIMNMRGMMKGLGEAAKSMPKQEKKPEQKKSGTLDNFKKTGKTKQVFGYTAQEYTKTFTDEDKESNGRSGTMSVWYAKVDFDPSMMFSMGMGKVGGPGAQARMQQSHPNNFFGMGLTEKNLLLVEVDAAETGGKSGTGMKVVSIEKTLFKQETSGFTVRNIGGMGMKDSMKK